MAGTYHQIYLHCIFSVKGRESLLSSKWRTEVFKYISGIITNKGHKSIIVNGVGDHVHLLFSLNPASSVSDIIRDVKSNSSKFINEKGWIRGKFAWQEGYGVFSYSKSQLDTIYQYIANQEEHHKKLSFQDEYKLFLQKFEIDFEEKYLFDWIED